MVPWAWSIRRAAWHRVPASVMDDVDNAARGRKVEDQIMAFLVRQGDWVTPRMEAQHVRNLSSGEVKSRLERMATVGRVTTRVTKQTTWSGRSVLKV